jgi:aminoglycoside phosphotransferase (APT) family kinase protein
MSSVLRALDGLGGLAPVPLGGDLNGRRSKHPTSLISWLDGQPDITPTDPGGWARELGCGLAAVHTVPTERLAELPSVFEGGGGSEEILGGPLAGRKAGGIVDWSGGSRGPRGFDLGWCRLDLVLLFDEQIADDFLAAYEAGTGQAVAEMRLWGLLGRRSVRRRGWVLGPELPAAGPRRPRRR